MKVEVTIHYRHYHHQHHHLVVLYLRAFVFRTKGWAHIHNNGISKWFTSVIALKITTRAKVTFHTGYIKVWCDFKQYRRRCASWDENWHFNEIIINDDTFPVRSTYLWHQDINFWQIYLAAPWFGISLFLLFHSICIYHHESWIMKMT